MDFTFNELSVKDVLNSHQMIYLINNVVSVMQKAYEIDNERPILRTETVLYNITLPCSTEKLHKYLSENHFSKEKLIFLADIHQKIPPIEKGEELYDDYLTIQCFYDNYDAKGFAYAYLLKNNALSLASHLKWDNSEIDVIINLLQNNETILTESETIKNVSKISDLDHFIKFHYDVIKDVAVIDDISKFSVKYFNNIKFGTKFIEYLKKFIKSKNDFSYVVSKLHFLSESFYQCNSLNDVFNKIPNCSNESESTMDIYGYQRKFNFENGSKMCETHFKLHKINYRIHFYPDFVERILYVGYIGPHLQTVKYKT